MIKRMKRKFILLAAVSLLVLLSVTVTGMNVINYRSVTAEADEILSLLSNNKGRFPGFEDPDMKNPIPGAPHENRLPQHMSPDLPYESRYFSVLLLEEQADMLVDVSRISSVDSETAVEYALLVRGKKASVGFLNQFRFLRTAEDGATRMIFLDCGRQLGAFYRFLTVSIVISVIGFLLLVAVVAFFAGRIVRPIAESYEKQKRFITDAGHEIKTPLTVIHANIDLLEMENGENESLDEIRRQAKQLSALTNDLILLSRMEESASPGQAIDFPVSEVISDTALSFRSIAEVEEKHFTVSVPPLLSMKGNSKEIARLVSILTDNALKYSPKGGTIDLTFGKNAHSLLLTVSNTTVETLDEQSLSRVFDRFYRTDPSRNSETGGHGIGLSIAKAIAESHGGKIRASMPKEKVFTVSVTFPLS